MLEKTICPKCGKILEVDKSLEASICSYCSSAYVVSKAIEKYCRYINNNDEEENIVINNSNIKSLIKLGLEYFNDQRQNDAELETISFKILTEDSENFYGRLFAIKCGDLSKVNFDICIKTENKEEMILLCKYAKKLIIDFLNEDSFKYNTKYYNKNGWYTDYYDYDRDSEYHPADKDFNTFLLLSIFEKEKDYEPCISSVKYLATKDDDCKKLYMDIKEQITKIFTAEAKRYVNEDILDLTNYKKIEKFYIHYFDKLPNSGYIVYNNKCLKECDYLLDSITIMVLATRSFWTGLLLIFLFGFVASIVFLIIYVIWRPNPSFFKLLFIVLALFVIDLILLIVFGIIKNHRIRKYKRFKRKNIYIK